MFKIRLFSHTISTSFKFSLSLISVGHRAANHTINPDMQKKKKIFLCGSQQQKKINKNKTNNQRIA